MPDSARARFFELRARLNAIVETFGHMTRDQEGRVHPQIKVLAGYAREELSMIRIFMESTVTVRAPEPTVISISPGLWVLDPPEILLLAKWSDDDDRRIELLSVPAAYRIAAQSIEKTFSYRVNEGAVTFEWTARFGFKEGAGTIQSTGAPKISGPTGSVETVPKKGDGVCDESWKEIQILSEVIRKLENDSRQFSVDAGAKIEPPWLRMILIVAEKSELVAQIIEAFTREDVPPPLVVDIIDQETKEEVVSLQATWNPNQGEYRFMQAPLHLRFFLKEIEDFLSWRRSGWVTFFWERKTMVEYREWVRNREAEESHRFLVR